MSIDTLTTTKEWALRYVPSGWRLFPIERGGKRPMYKGWQKDATTNPEMIVRWWRREPAPNIGVICGELFDVFDIEAPFISAFTEWQADHDYVLPETPLARSGRRGLHIFTQPTGIDHTTNLYLNGAHVGELKSRGGGVVLCPSVTEGPYAWLWLPHDLRAAPAPVWLLSLLDQPQGARVRRWPSRVISATEGGHRLDALAQAVSKAPEGRRNAVLYWAARRAAEEGVPLKLLGLALLRAAVAAGLPEREAEATIVSAVRAEGVG